MQENTNSLSFSDEEKTAISQAIQTLNTLLSPKLIALSAVDRRRMAKVGDQAIPMIEKVAHYVETNPEFLPLFGDAEKFKKNFSASTTLHGFIRSLAQVVTNLEDSAKLADVEADEFARRYYASAGQAAKMRLPGAMAIYDDLKKRYEGQQRSRSGKKPVDK